MAAKKGELNNVKVLVNQRPADVNIQDASSGVSLKDYTIVVKEMKEKAKECANA